MHIKLVVRDGSLREAMIDVELPDTVGGDYLSKLKVKASRERERQTKARAFSVQVHKLFNPLEEEVSCKKVAPEGMLIDIAHLIDTKSVEKYQNRYSSAAKQLKNCEVMQSRIVNNDLDKLVNALRQPDSNADIYHFLTDEQLPKLKIGSFDGNMIDNLIQGLYRKPECIFGAFDEDIMFENITILEAARARFALLDTNELQQVIEEKKIGWNPLLFLISDPQFQALEFSKLDLDFIFEKLGLFANDEETDARRHHLYQLVPDKEIQQAIRGKTRSRGWLMRFQIWV